MSDGRQYDATEARWEREASQEYKDRKRHKTEYEILLKCGVPIITMEDMLYLMQPAPNNPDSSFYSAERIARIRKILQR